MGRGDKKSKKGKIAKGSYGNSRRKKAIKAKLKRNAVRKPVATAPVEAAEPKAKKAPRKKAEA